MRTRNGFETIKLHKRKLRTSSKTISEEHILSERWISVKYVPIRKLFTLYTYSLYCFLLKGAIKFPWWLLLSHNAADWEKWKHLQQIKTSFKIKNILCVISCLHIHSNIIIKHVSIPIPVLSSHTNFDKQKNTKQSCLELQYFITDC